MTAIGGNGDSELETLRNELVGDVDALMREAELVYAELVLPRWGSAEDHGFPRTLYGYVVASFSMIDLLSHHRYSDPSQTARMRSFHGSDVPCEKPSDADLRLETVNSDPAENARRIVDALERG